MARVIIPLAHCPCAGCVEAREALAKVPPDAAICPGCGQPHPFHAMTCTSLSQAEVDEALAPAHELSRGLPKAWPGLVADYWRTWRESRRKARIATPEEQAETMRAAGFDGPEQWPMPTRESDATAELARAARDGRLVVGVDLADGVSTSVRGYRDAGGIHIVSMDVEPAPGAGAVQQNEWCGKDCSQCPEAACAPQQKSAISDTLAEHFLSASAGRAPLEWIDYRGQHRRSSAGDVLHVGKVPAGATYGDVKRLLDANRASIEAFCGQREMPRTATITLRMVVETMNRSAEDLMREILDQHEIDRLNIEGARNREAARPAARGVHGSQPWDHAAGECP